jgi:RimJ/RimL family protein N-acetyltransferase
MTSAQITLASAQPILQRVEIRPLVGDEASIYFPLRDGILKSGDGHFFSDSYTRERKLLTPEQQRDWCTESREHCIMGAFANGALVGIVMITQYGAPENSTVEWEAAWVDLRYRGSGLTKALYERVEQWTVDQGYNFVEVHIRSDNKRWLGVRQKLGFDQVGIRRVEEWADGTPGDSLIFRLDLHAPTLEHTVRHLGEAIVSFNQGALVPPTGIREGGTATPATPVARGLNHKTFG